MTAELLQTILIAVVTNGAVLALFLWVFKVAFEKALDKRVKLYEKELELQHKKSFHRFSKVFDEQAETLRDVYAQLVELNDRAAYLAYHYQVFEKHPDLLERYRIPETGSAVEWDRYLKNTLSAKPEDARAEELANAASQALKKFRPRRIYFLPTTANDVERLMSLFLFVGSEFRNVNYRDPHTLEQIIAPEVIDAWKRALSASQVLFPQLEDLFRQHLGHGTHDA
ncbi:MAG: hypothetical protein M1449_00585 [Candidatus Thermoplasmatota archaeon]|nr:hypothetical protein [Candidatus Thermoplasmatota archaeon]